MGIVDLLSIAAGHSPFTPGNRRFTVDEYYRMAEVGILTDLDHVELIDGEIVEMNAMGAKHAEAVGTISEQFFPQAAAANCRLRVQLPVRLDVQNEPEPDVAIVRRNETGYGEHHPGPADLLLAIEVADSSLEIDRRRKLPMYARFGIAEVWLVNLLNQSIEVYRRPSGDAFQEQLTLNRNDRLNSSSLPSLTLDVAAILG